MKRIYDLEVVPGEKLPVDHQVCVVLPDREAQVDKKWQGHMRCVGLGFIEKMPNTLDGAGRHYFYSASHAFVEAHQRLGLRRVHISHTVRKGPDMWEIATESRPRQWLCGCEDCAGRWKEGWA